MDNGSQRLDKWLWFARLFKTRAEAAAMCSSRHLRMDGRVVDKPHALVRIGTVISFPKAGRVVVVKVEGMAERRGPYSTARLLYSDMSPATPASAPLSATA